jgi:hypothetical protein
VRADFSEFSYGYAFTEELVRGFSNQIKAAPLFPSLRAEGRDDGGYDVRLDFNRPGDLIYIQFKLSQCLNVKSNTPEYCEHGYFSPGTRIYRFQITASQHNALRRHEENEHNVFYVTPCFCGQDAFNRIYLTREIARETQYFIPSEIDLSTEKSSHTVTFEVGGAHLVRSEPVPIKRSLNFTEWRERLEKVVASQQQPFRQYLAERAEVLFVELSDMLATPVVKSLQSQLDTEPLSIIAFHATYVLQTSVYVLQRRSE